MRLDRRAGSWKFGLHPKGAGETSKGRRVRNDAIKICVPGKSSTGNSAGKYSVNIGRIREGAQGWPEGKLPLGSLAVSSNSALCFPVESHKLTQPQTSKASYHPSS